MENLLVSVIITTYGREQSLLMQAINSVLEQTYKNIELIVVDDNGRGSNQQLCNEKVLSQYNDIVYVCNEKNSGVQYSRNVGILRSKGAYVAFLDDDDVWCQEKIYKQIELLEKENLGMVFCNGYRFQHNNYEQVTIYQKNFISNRLISFDLELENDHIGSTSNPLIRRECFAKAGLFDLAMPARQDYDMWIRICKYYMVKGVNEPLFYYRSHSGTRITKSEKKSFDSHMLLWKKYMKEYKKNKHAKANAMLAMAIASFKMSNYLGAVYFSFRALISKPIYVIKFIFGKRKVF